MRIYFDVIGNLAITHGKEDEDFIWNWKMHIMG